MIFYVLQEHINNIQPNMIGVYTTSSDLGLSETHKYMQVSQLITLRANIIADAAHLTIYTLHHVAGSSVIPLMNTHGVGCPNIHNRT